MIVYRISLEKFSGKLQASGNPARWNSKDVKTIYTASSRSLACLENIVHRSAIGPHELFRTMVIEIPDGMAISTIHKKDLIEDWFAFKNYPFTQSLGDSWMGGMTTAVLKVPSAIIPEEANYLLNPAHPDYTKIKLKKTEPFEFDQRLRGR